MTSKADNISFTPLEKNITANEPVRKICLYLLSENMTDTFRKVNGIF
jgi:hypothetical protein